MNIDYVYRTVATGIINLARFTDEELNKLLEELTVDILGADSHTNKYKLVITMAHYVVASEIAKRNPQPTQHDAKDHGTMVVEL